MTEDKLRTPAPAAPPIENFEAIEDPFDCVAALCRLAEVMGYRFPRRHAALRRAKLRQIRRMQSPDGKPRYSLAEIGAAVDLHATRVWQLLTAGKPAGPDAPTSGPAPTCAPLPTQPSASGPLTSTRTRKTVGGGDLTVAEATS